MSKAPRNIVDVLDRIEAIAPTDAKLLFSADLSKFRRDLPYCPPEIIAREWGKLGAIVTAMVGEPPLIEGWQINVVAELMNVPEGHARTMYGAR